jgi:hypothetical protein
MSTPLAAEQRAELSGNWRAIAQPPLVKQLDALVGPPLSVLAEACTAYNLVSSTPERPKNHNVCNGDTVAVVTRYGSPEAPGAIYKHYPGCMKHSEMALGRLGAVETSVSGRRVFHSIIALTDARREIRQQELADETAHSQRWWHRW